tara:strand:- start:545 stop:1240 length:696 start_codon:yes stop_codon:yes gene_type:complete
MPTQEEKQECLRLNALYKNKVAQQIANGEQPIDQQMIGEAFGVIEGKDPIDQSRISQILTGYSKITIERAIVFSSIIGCEIEEFSPRIASLLKGISVSPKRQRLVSVIDGSSSEVSAVAKKIAQGKKPKIKDGSKQIAYPGHCSLETRAFYVDSPQMEPFLSIGSYAFVDPSEELKTGDQVAIVRDDRLLFAGYMGAGYFEYSNPKFAEKPFLVATDCVVGPVIGIYIERR